MRRPTDAGSTGRSPASTRRRHLRGQAFELAATDVLEILPARDWSTPPRRDRPEPRSARRPVRATSLASATQSSIVMPSIGTNGTTSIGAETGMFALMRRADRCVASACSNIASTAVLSGAASPTSVKTERLCEASDEWSSSRTPDTARMAAAIASTTSGRRPSLTFGMHSMIGHAQVLVPGSSSGCSGSQSSSQCRVERSL